MDGQSLDILSEKLSKLKELYPEAFSEDQIDWEKLQATLGNQINLSQERYHLNWAGKSEVFRILQQRTSATLIPVPEESYPVKSSFCHSESTLQSGEESQNIFIEGENLEVLKVLQKSYFGKIKMIYIDPPYNTGSDSFIYPDRFAESKDEYLKRIGDKDEEGFLLKEGMIRKNSKDSGHYHSNWLSMMYPRLYLARNLLRDDGVIFVSIDDNEVHNLRMIMNEIFGEENFVGNIVRATGTTTGQGSGSLGKSFDFVLVFSKMSNYEIGGIELTEKDILRYNLEDDKGKFSILQLRRTGSQDRREDRPNMFFPIKSPDGTNVFPKGPTGYESRWRVGKTRYEKMVEDDLIYWKKNDEDEWVAYFKYYVEGRTKRPSNLWNDLEGNKKAQIELKDLFEKKVFDTPKPIDFLNRCLQISTSGDNNEIILDFFAGSGTTAQAVMELNKEDSGNRKFILVQLPEKTDEATEAYKADYKSIADICKERIRRVIKKIDNPEENKIKTDPNQTNLGLEEKQGNSDHQSQTTNNQFSVFKLAPSNFKIWRSDVIENTEDLEKMMNIFDDQVKPNAEKENMLYELLLKSGYQLTVETAYIPSPNGGYYSINKNETIILLEVIDQAIIEEILKLQPKNVIALDKLFVGNDQLKTNTVLQMKDANIEFRTV